jgi:hypothetical protein
VTAKELEGMVNEAMQEGWEPYGQPSFYGIYLQALVKRREPEMEACAEAKPAYREAA